MRVLYQPVDTSPHFDRIPLEQAPSSLGAGVAHCTPHELARSLYIHVPFCFHKCHYCDFYSFVDSQDRQAPFVDALVRELGSLAKHADTTAGLSTIFVGGGTPSLLLPALWRKLLAEINDLFNLEPITSGSGEFTVECNPETVTSELMDVLAAGGVNRVSVGAQSFNTDHLKTLERWHEPTSVQRALRYAAQAGIRRRSLDLIYAIPGQTLDDVRNDLEIALAMAPGVEHISAYCLTYEPNTPMKVRVERGDVTPISDDLSGDMQTLVYEMLRDAGFERYEISNFARIGTGAATIAQVGESPSPLSHQSQTSPAHSCRSQHNLVYWHTGSWLAAGPAASGHLLATDPATGLPAGRRWKNIPHLTHWMAGLNETGFSPIIDYEPADARRTLVERIMMGIRVSEGLNTEKLLSHARALRADTQLADAAAMQIKLGFLGSVDDHWRLTERGFLFADAVAAEMMSAVQA